MSTNVKPAGKRELTSMRKQGVAAGALHPEGRSIIRAAEAISTWSQEAPETRDVLAQMETLRVVMPPLSESLAHYSDDLLNRDFHWKVTRKIMDASISMLEASASLLEARKLIAQMYDGQILQEESGVIVTKDEPHKRR